MDIKLWLKRYKRQRAGVVGRLDAAGQPIEMRMTFEEWLCIWAASGKMELHGNRRGHYVMSRHNDLGHYEVGNVSIVLHEENVAAARRGKPLSAAHKAKMSAARTGVSYAPSVTRAHSNRTAALARPRLSCLHCRKQFTTASLALHLKPLDIK